MSECFAAAEIMIEKFDMYQRHFRKINNRDNHEWLRNMIHSFIQQLMRQYFAFTECMEGRRLTGSAGDLWVLVEIDVFQIRVNRFEEKLA